jgi:glyoxylase-like metal-dependent hydrolase (beta-lactamase superfamily II)
MARLTLQHLRGNSYLIPSPANIGLYVRDGRAILIDSGNDDEAGRQLAKLIAERGWTLDLIVHTHSNADHIGGNAFLQKKTGCRIAATPLEAPFIHHPPLEAAFLYGGFPLPALRNKFLMAKASTVTDLIAEEGAILDTGLEALPLPGHYFGMIGVRTPDDVLFLGDSLFAAEILDKYPLFFLYDIAAQLQTLERLRTTQAALFVPSHAAPTSDISPLIAANAARIAATLASIRRGCAGGASFEQILAELCREFSIVLDANQYVLVGAAVRSFLSYLVARGEVATRFDGDRLLWQAAA